ncbi:biotin-independent malonate decarboxylase subunit beta [Ignatzschineria sp. F8392]|uniref:biotin-independent malonate decarboxylase subunit beta n=1 Tax=Ignatzschineria sp. F8392 TaxID=1980117 RepID=UPI000B998840|nr:biotin-independent malonate decarboxylase subunit beta [Ignatzschineria sp. F8392]OYQ81363.1 biotin-independent malonate decarboxylase subunit beta [Ignatzschineria sp. F8392]
MRNSFVELNGRERAIALLDAGSATEFLDPYDGIMSPYLLPQGIVPQSDDGVILMRGQLQGREALVISLEGHFQGGGIGEVGGAKISAALEKVLNENRAGKKIYPILILDTGGVRLQEANYGLLSISEIQNMIVALREYVSVIGLVPGLVGSFGGMSITSALTSYLIATNRARVGLNGPEVIEQEAGVREFDSSDQALIWDTIGVNQKAKTGLVDEVVTDDVATIIATIEKVIENPPTEYRSRQLDRFLKILEEVDFSHPLTPEAYAKQYQKSIQEIKTYRFPLVTEGASAESDSRGYHWFSQLTGIKNPHSEIPSVLAADVVQNGQMRRYLAIVPNRENRFYRVRNGEVGLQEGFVLAKQIWEVIEADRESENKRPIIMVIDVPSQAYGYKEELIGIHLALAASVDAYATARQLGHPVIGVIVGNAISGAFLAHGLQSNRLIALDDPKINVQAMSKASAARVTMRTIEEIDAAAAKVPAIAYDIESFQKLGALYQLLEVSHADQPTEVDVALLLKAITESIASLSPDERDLSFRYKNREATSFGRVETNRVRARLEEVWR